LITLQEKVFGLQPPKSWRTKRLHTIFRVRRGIKNVGLIEDNLLSLSYGRIVEKDIEAVGGLLPESFETYQIVEPGNIVLRLTDLQNDKKSLRQGLVTVRGIITSAYDALEVAPSERALFLFYTLLALDHAKYYYSLGGGVRQSIKFSDFPNEWLALPDIVEQQATIEYLQREEEKIDAIIGAIGGGSLAKNAPDGTLLQLLLEKRAALVAAAVTGHLALGHRPVDENAVRADPGLRSRAVHDE
jgi:type I restriction enzyme S subunit